jgi:hypothetical protein
VAVHRLIKKERQTPKAKTTKLTHTSDCITPIYIINLTRLRPIHYLQLTLC